MLDTLRFNEIVNRFYRQLLETNTNITDLKLTEDKWSLKEIIGHLIDSASNNHQRFVRLQFGDLLDFPGYETAKWLRVQKYNNMNWDVLVTLWYNYNCLLINVIENADETMYGNAWVDNEETITLEELIYDYYKHLEEHIEHFCNRQKEIIDK